MSGYLAETPEQESEETQERLRRQIDYCLQTPFYRDLFEQHSLDPGKIRTLRDVWSMPVLVTPDIHRQAQEATVERDGHPFGSFLAAPLEDVVAVSSTSGTTGVPTMYAFTGHDVAVTDALWQKALRFVGVKPGDCVLQGFGLSMYLAGMPLVRALERMGARPVPIGAEAGAEKLLRMARLVRPRVLACTPSYAEHLLERVPDVLGMSARDLGIEIIVCAGEPGAGLPEVRRKLQEGWGAQVFDMLGGAHGVMNSSCDYPEYQGMHVLGSDYSVSTHLVDPVSREPINIADGVTGERVKTSIEWDAQPPLRYSVGDTYQVFTDPCPCGRPGLRVKVLGRVDDLLIVKGVKIYPAAIKNLVNGFVPDATGEMRILLDSPPPRVVPPLRLRVEYRDGLDAAAQDALRAAIIRAMHDRLTIRPDVTLVPAGSLPRSTKKTQLIERVFEESKE
ncbi:MAG: phenylacetate--CoA ligase family protein [Nostocoides sp.]